MNSEINDSISSDGYFKGSTGLQSFKIPRKINANNTNEQLEFKSLLPAADHSDNQNNSYKSYNKYRRDKMATANPKSKRKNQFNTTQAAKKQFVYKDTYPVFTDPNLPQELTVMFQPLFCKLCDMNLSSMAQSKIHYQSKNHKKKIKTWVIEWSKKTGQPIPIADQTLTSSNDHATEDDPKYVKCDLCDISFTSKMHAESHYMGKNHQKVLNGQKSLLRDGFYDNDGKFHRTLKKPDGKFGIGTSFANDVVAPNIQSNEIASPETGGQTPVDTSYSPDINTNSFQTAYSPNVTQSPVAMAANQTHLYCSYCNINATSADQMTSHLKGQRHMKVLKKMGIEVTEKVEPRNEPSLLTTVTNPSIVRQINSESDYSIFRTPSGNYYCSSCNVSVSSEMNFKQHIQSKKHIKSKHKS